MIRPHQRAAELAEKISGPNYDPATIAMIEAHDAEVRREAFEAAANAADRLIRGSDYGMGAMDNPSQIPASPGSTPGCPPAGGPVRA